VVEYRGWERGRGIDLVPVAKEEQLCKLQLHIQPQILQCRWYVWLLHIQRLFYLEYLGLFLDMGVFSNLENHG
jgi:hypothetical protein